MPPSAITGTSASRAASAASRIGGELRHADAGDDAGGADRARADADLDRIGAGVDQRLRALAGRDIAGDDRDLVGGALDAPDLVAGPAPNGHARCRRRGNRRPPPSAARRARTLVADGGGGGDAQAAVGVLGGVRMRGRLLDVLDGDEPDAAAASSTTTSFSMRC